MLFSGGKDISRILRDWSYDATKVNVRRILGEDGREKIQLRLDLGILQMETNGRPDGKRPYGYKSLLDYHLNALEKYRKKHKNDEGFYLSHEDCAYLQQESIQYYHRYLSLFHLGDYEGVAKDTLQNLKIFDFVNKYAEDPKDQYTFEQFRPYVIMMHVRAKGSLKLKKKEFDHAIKVIEKGINQIEDLFVKRGIEGELDNSPEIDFLKRWLEEVKEQKPLDPVERTKRELDEAVRVENYELAAKLRDQLRDIRTQRKKNDISL